MQPTVGIGLLGCGTVGGGVAELLLRHRQQIAGRAGVAHALRGIAVRSLDKRRPEIIDRSLFTRDARAVIDDRHVDLIVECVGGLGDAVEFVERALERGKHVVTANKDLIATQGPRLLALAASKGAALHYEAAVGGAIPIVRTLDASLAGDQIVEVAGILNGTSNFILSAMHEGASYAQALREAQERGFAESDPHNDVEGIDAAHKLAILIQLAFRQAVISPRIRRNGISAIRQADVAAVKASGYTIKLLAVARKTPTGALAEVGAVALPDAHPFAAIGGAQNVVRTISAAAGALTFTGLGAGREPSASAVLGDVVGALRAVGERHDLSTRARYAAPLSPAIDVEPLFHTFESIAGYPIFTQGVTYVHDDRPEATTAV